MDEPRPKPDKPKPKDLPFRPLKEVLVKRDEAFERLLILTGHRDSMLFGLAFGEVDVHELYDLVENNNAICLRYYLVQLLGEEVSQEILRAYIEPSTIDRLPGMIITGKLIDFLNLLDPSKISYEEGVGEVAKSIEALNDGENSLYLGSNLDTTFGFCVGQAMAVSSSPKDVHGDRELVQKLMNTYTSLCDEERKELFMSGYRTSFPQASENITPPTSSTLEPGNYINTYQN